MTIDDSIARSFGSSSVLDRQQAWFIATTLQVLRLRSPSEVSGPALIHVCHGVMTSPLLSRICSVVVVERHAFRMEPIRDLPMLVSSLSMAVFREYGWHNGALRASPLFQVKSHDLKPGLLPSSHGFRQSNSVEH